MGQSRARARLVIAAGVAAAALAACGGDDEQQAQAPPQTTETQQETVPGGSLTTPPAEGAGSGESEPARTFSARPAAELERAALRELRRLRRKRRLSAAERATARQTAVRNLANAVVLAFGLSKADLTVGPEGRTVAVVVDPKQACAGRPVQEQKLVERITAPEDGAESVTVQVRDAGSLDSYVKRRCKSRARARGRIVYRESAFGIVEGREFKVRSSSWRVEYENSGSLLQVFVLRGGELRDIAVNRKGRGSAVETVQGSGTFSLRIAGSGEWTVRVREGAG